MRILTGDECGLLKETIPELCRPPETNDGNGGGVASSSSYAAVHAGTVRPSATSIQAAASAYATNGTGGGGGEAALKRAVKRLEPGEDAQRRERGVVSLAFLPRDANHDSDGNSDGASTFRFAALRTNGIVETWAAHRTSSGYDRNEANVTAAAYKRTGGLPHSVLPDTETGEGNDESDAENNGTNRGWHAQQSVRPIGMVSACSSNDEAPSSHPILATCDSIGNISLMNANDMSKGVVATYNAFDIDPSAALPHPSSSKNAIGQGTLTYTRGRFANNHIATAVAMCGRERLAVGGRERGARVLDLESGKLLWKAKNLPPDPQTLLQQPLWTTCMQFLQTPTAAIHNTGNDAPNLLATGTAYKQVQIYDIRSSSTTRRPVLYTPEGLLDHRATAVCQLPDGNTLAVADATGDVHLLDLRNFHSGKQFTTRKQKAKEEMGLGRLVGPGGSVRQVACHPTLPYLACVGLDRKLWTWDWRRRKMVDCVYLKQRLNCLLVCDDEGWGDEEADKEAAEGVYEEEGREMGSRRVLEDDAVEDYVDSEDDGDGKEGGDGVEGGASSSEETASDSEEDALEGEETEDGIYSEEEEEPKVKAAAVRPKKRRIH